MIFKRAWSLEYFRDNSFEPYIELYHVWNLVSPFHLNISMEMEFRSHLLNKIIFSKLFLKLEKMNRVQIVTLCVST